MNKSQTHTHTQKDHLENTNEEGTIVFSESASLSFTTKTSKR